MNSDEVTNAYNEFIDIKNKINLLEDLIKTIKDPPPTFQELFESISELSILMIDLDKKYGQKITLLEKTKLQKQKK